jgi:hypothetical protein
MTWRVVGAVGVCALVFLAYAPTAGADSIKLNGPVPAGTAMPSRASWNSADFSGQLDVMVVDGQLMGTWGFGTVNPFLRDLTHGGDDVQVGLGQLGLEEARRFLSSSQEGSSAALFFKVQQTGDRDGDTMGDYRVQLTGEKLTTFGKEGLGSRSPIPTPEPASLVLVGSGLLGLAYEARRRRRVSASR